jgi:hypothetical protein
MVWYADVLAMRRRLAGALRRMMNVQLSKAWEQWQVAILKTTATALSLPPLRALTTPAPGVVRQYEGPAAEARWGVAAHDEPQALDGLGAVAGRILSLLHLPHCVKHQAWYAELKDQQFRLAGALRRMMNRKLSMAWEQWQYW